MLDKVLIFMLVFAHVYEPSVFALLVCLRGEVKHHVERKPRFYGTGYNLLHTCVIWQGTQLLKHCT